MAGSGKTGPSSGRLPWALLLLYTFFVFKLTLIPSERLPGFLTRFDDKTLHVFGYALLFSLAWHAALRTGVRKMPAFLTPPVFAAVWSVAVAGLSESLQQFVPGRFPDPADFGADLTGIFLGFILLRFVLGRIGRRKKGGAHGLF